MCNSQATFYMPSPNLVKADLLVYVAQHSKRCTLRIFVCLHCLLHYNVLLFCFHTMPCGLLLLNHFPSLRSIFYVEFRRPCELTFIYKHCQNLVGSTADLHLLTLAVPCFVSRSSCVFSLTLHYIENLPSNYNGRRVAVNWLRKENYVDSKPATVSEGFADFEEILHLKCTMYGGKGGTKYLPKSSTLSVCAVDGDRAVLGRHKLDLSRLLPNGDAPGRRGSQGGLDGSTVSFPLTIGTLTVTFGYKVSSRARPALALCSTQRKSFRFFE
jgi:hypothetical protein